MENNNKNHHSNFDISDDNSLMNAIIKMIEQSVKADKNTSMSKSKIKPGQIDGYKSLKIKKEKDKLNNYDTAYISAAQANCSKESLKEVPKFILDALQCYRDWNKNRYKQSIHTMKIECEGVCKEFTDMIKSSNKTTYLSIEQVNSIISKIYEEKFEKIENEYNKIEKQIRDFINTHEFV